MDVALEKSAVCARHTVIKSTLVKLLNFFTLIELLPFPLSLKFPEMAVQGVRDAVVNTMSSTGPVQGTGDRYISRPSLF